MHGLWDNSGAKRKAGQFDYVTSEHGECMARKRIGLVVSPRGELVEGWESYVIRSCHPPAAQKFLENKEWTDPCWVKPHSFEIESGVPRGPMLPVPIGHYFWDEGGERQPCHSAVGPALWPKWEEDRKNVKQIFLYDRRGPPGCLRALTKEDVWCLQGRPVEEFRRLALAEAIGEEKAAEEGCKATGMQTATNLLAAMGCIIAQYIEEDAGRAGTSTDPTGADAMAQILVWLRKWRQKDFQSHSSRAGGADSGFCLQMDGVLVDRSTWL